MQWPRFRTQGIATPNNNLWYLLKHTRRDRRLSRVLTRNRLQRYALDIDDKVISA
jgi:hypothetical protein